MWRQQGGLLYYTDNTLMMEVKESAMTLAKLLPAVTAIALLGACEARIGNDAAPVDANDTAANQSEEGRLTVAAPGFNLQLDIPESIMSRAEMDGDNDIVYPGASFGGIHIQGGRDSGGEDSVELRFSTGDDLARVHAWYRDPARAAHFTVATETREGETIVLAGTDVKDNDRFTLRLAARASGGTEARLLLHDGN